MSKGDRLSGIPYWVMNGIMTLQNSTHIAIARDLSVHNCLHLHFEGGT